MVNKNNDKKPDAKRSYTKLSDELRATITERLDSVLCTVNNNELATSLGVNPSQVSQWRNRDEKYISIVPNTEQMIKIAKYCNVSLDYLYGIDENQTQDKDVQFVCNYTGLSEQSANLMHSFVPKDNADGFMRISEDDKFSLTYGESQQYINFIDSFIKFLCLKERDAFYDLCIAYESYEQIVSALEITDAELYEKIENGKLHTSFDLKMYHSLEDILIGCKDNKASFLGNLYLFANAFDNFSNKYFSTDKLDKNYRAIKKEYEQDKKLYKSKTSKSKT